MGLHLILFALSWDLSTAGRWAQVIIGLGLVIFVHELGHFVVAKLCGVKCEKFYLGFDFFGLRLARFRWGETEYGIGAFPLGGYVKMLGQEDNPSQIAEELERARAARSRAAAPVGGTISRDSGGMATATLDGDPSAEFDPRSFWAQSVPKRLAIMLAGVAMNALFAFVLAAIAFAMGVQEQPGMIGSVQPGSPAWQADVRPGDTLLELGGVKDPSFEDIMKTVMLARSGEGVVAVIQRPGVTEPIRKELQPYREGERKFVGVGNAATTELALRTPLSPAAPRPEGDAALPPGAKVTAVDGRPVASQRELEARLAEAADRPVRLTLEAPEKDGAAARASQVTLPPRPWRSLGFEAGFGPIVALQSGSPAEAAGLKVGDQILRIDGQPIGDPLTLDQRLARRAGEAVDVEVQRGESPLTVSVTPRALDSLPPTSQLTAPLAVNSLGVAFRTLPDVAAVPPDSAAEKAGLKAGQKIVSFRLAAADDAPSDEKEAVESFNRLKPEERSNWAAVSQFIQDLSPGAVVGVTLADGKEINLVVVDQPGYYNADRGLIFQPALRTRAAKNLFDAVVWGSEEAIEFLYMPYQIIQRMVTGDISFKAIAGPVGIVGAAGAASERPSTLILFLAMLSANLAVLNLLPVPILDGGHVVFLLLEWIRGKPVSERVFLAASYIGLILILALLVSVTIGDVGRLFR